MIVVLMITTLGLIVAAGMLESAASNARTRALVQTRSRYYYQVEETLNRTVAWLQDNSKYIVSAFEGTEFNANFDLGAPANGDNEGAFFGVPTMVKMKGTNDSPMLSNNNFFGTATFPGLTNIDDGTALNPVDAFAAADLGEANARVVLVWARETDGNFEPIFRIDVVTGNNPDRGVHSYSYVYSTLVSSSGGTGFYGEDSLNLNTPNNTCRSYQYTHDGANWNRGAPRANCPIASDGAIDISSQVEGTAKSLSDPGINFNPPGGEVSGDTCEGAGCHSYALPPGPAWDTSCPGGGSDITVSSDTTLAAGGCYRDIAISNKKVLSLTDTTAPYYIRGIDFSGAQGNIDFGTIPPGEKVTVYVEVPNSNYTLNGNRVINSINAPHQVEIYYVGSTPLTLNGTSVMSATLFAPNAAVTVSGNFNFYGGILAKELLVNGHSTISYDENLGVVPVLSDLNFSLRKASQRYR